MERSCVFTVIRYVSEKNDGTIGTDRVISVANMYFKPDARVSSADYLKTYNLFRHGDIAFEGNKSKNFAFGRFVENTIGDGIVSHVLFTVFRPIASNHNLDYWSYAINNENVMGRILSRCTKKTTMMTNLVIDDFLVQKICCPSEMEQQRIAGFLKKIDDRIEKQTTLIETLKKYKRGVVRTLLSPKHCKLKNVEWTTAKIGDIGTFIKGAPLSKADISSDGTPFILYGELYTTYNEVISKVVRKTQASVDKQYYSQIGDVIIPTSGETPEEISTASCVMLPDIILAGDLNIYRCTQVDGRIMSYILNHVVNDRIARVAQGKSIVHVQATEISKIEITYPDLISQKKLIETFDAITARIDQSMRELELLQVHRKALLQQLFI